MSERALEDQPGRRKFKRIYGSKQRKSGLQGKTEHRHAQPSPSSAHLALGQPGHSSLGSRSQGSVSRALFCSSFRGLEAATGPSHLRGPPLPKIPLRQACALAPATHGSPLGPAPPPPSLRLLGSTADSTGPFPARHCRRGPEELPFLSGLLGQSSPLANCM